METISALDLSSKIALVEVNIVRKKKELEFIKSKLEAAYKYKDEQYDRMKMADKMIEKAQLELFQKTGEIVEDVDKIKSAVNKFSESLQ